jgi:Zn finger protein HypA/HybF involved in hydrogenase expression
VHEQGLLAKAAARLLGGEPVRAIRVSIGPRADRDVVEMSWPNLVAGTPLAEAEVTFADVQDPMVCLDCAAEYEGSTITSCPACGGNGLPIALASDVDVEVIEP